MTCLKTEDQSPEWRGEDGQNLGSRRLENPPGLTIIYFFSRPDNCDRNNLNIFKAKYEALVLNDLPLPSVVKVNYKMKR